MFSQLRRSVFLALISLLLFGLVYPLAGTALSQVAFHHQANGSLSSNGSTLIGQNWAGPTWFHGRPDDTKPYTGDNPMASGATNLGPRSKVLVANTRKLIAWWHSMGVNPTPDLVTTSGSGLDPDITKGDAWVQIPMIAKATGIAPSALKKLILEQVRPAQFGFLGTSYIDVLSLNEGLARLKHGSS